jgi:glycosyltransferase involved in cell wall biosynthesis
VSIVHHPRCYESHPVALKWLYRLIERSYLSSVDGFIFNSETTRTAVSRILDRSTLPNTLVAYPAGDRFQPSLTSDQIAARSNHSGPLRIVFVGNLIPRKGLHVLIEALAKLPPAACELTVVGNPAGDERYARAGRQQIARQALTNVRLAGALPDDQLAAVLARSHVMVVPSDYEGFGIVYLEGMSFGLPAIATTNGAAHEVIADGVEGYLIAPNDAAALASRLRELQADRALLARLSLAARQRFLAQPTWDDSMAKVRNYLTSWLT